MTIPVANNVYAAANGNTSTSVFITYFSSVSPTIHDVNFQPTQRWFNLTDNEEYILINFSVVNGIKTANWQPLSSSSDLRELTADTGVAVPAAGAIKISGGTTGITTTAAASEVDLTGTLNVSHGGTGNTSFTAYSVICAGTTSANPFQNVSGLGNAGNVLTSNGAGALPTWQSASGLLFPITFVSTSPYVVLASDYFLAVNTNSIPITIQLPNAPSVGKVYYIKDSNGNAFANNITVTTVGGVVLIDASATYLLNINYRSIALVFDGTKWEIF